MRQCCEKGKGRPGEREWKGGHVTMLRKRKREGRGEGMERWACDNVVKRGKGACYNVAKKGKEGM